MKKARLKAIPQTEQFGYELGDLETSGEKDLLAKLLRPNALLFDVGAKTGAWSRATLEVEPNIYLYSFESNPSRYQELKNSLSSHSGARVHSISPAPLDQFCLSEGIFGIDFLKMSSENLSLLEGAESLLKEKKISSIQFTYSQASSSLKEAAQKLSHHDFSLFRIFSHGLIHMSHWKDWLENKQTCHYFAILKSNISQCDPMIF